VVGGQWSVCAVSRNPPLDKTTTDHGPLSTGH